MVNAENEQLQTHKHKIWCNAHNLLSQRGTLPLHSLLAWHVLSAVPFSVYPVSHEYLATSPKEVPALVFTWPLLWLTSGSQDTPVIK